MDVKEALEAARAKAVETLWNLNDGYVHGVDEAVDVAIVAFLERVHKDLGGRPMSVWGLLAAIREAQS